MLVSLNTAFAVTENKDGSVTLSKQELAQLNDQVNLLVQKAFQAGASEALELLKSNPKLCPKDI